MLACSAALVALSLMPATPLMALFAVAFAAAGLSSVDQPHARRPVPRLVPPERLPAAIALNQLNFQVGSVVGPAIGGLLIATVGLPGAYVADVLRFSASHRRRRRDRATAAARGGDATGLAAIREGLRFVGARRVILSTFVIDLNAMIFGMPTSLFPALALDVFKVGPQGLGLMAAAPAAGAFLGALLSGWVSAVRRVGLAVIIAVVIWGAAITLFGLSTFSFALALVFLAIAGAADVVSAVFRSTIVQLETPDHLRGRVTSIHILVVTSGPRLGDIEAATVAAVIGAQASVVSGGLLCIAGVGVVARLFPELGRARRPHGGRRVASRPSGTGRTNSKSKTSWPGSNGVKNGGIVRPGVRRRDHVRVRRRTGCPGAAGPAGPGARTAAGPSDESTTA